MDLSNGDTVTYLPFADRLTLTLIGFPLNLLFPKGQLIIPSTQVKSMAPAKKDALKYSRDPGFTE